MEVAPIRKSNVSCALPAPFKNIDLMLCMHVGVYCHRSNMDLFKKPGPYFAESLIVCVHGRFVRCRLITDVRRRAFFPGPSIDGSFGPFSFLILSIFSILVRSYTCARSMMRFVFSMKILLHFAERFFY